MYQWTDAGASGWGVYYPDEPVRSGDMLTLAQLGKIPGASSATLLGYGWVSRAEQNASPSAVWTSEGVAGWGGFFPDDEKAPGAVLTEAELAKVPNGSVEALVGYSWVKLLTSPIAVWTRAGVGGWSSYFPDEAVIEGSFLAQTELAKIPGGSVEGLVGYGWVELIAD